MQVLHGASVRGRGRPRPLAPRIELRRIGVGIDDTPESALALLMARELARPTGARLSLRAVVDETVPGWVGLSVTPSYVDALRSSLEERRAAAQELLARRSQACEGVTADGAVVVGHPAGELVLASEGLDLLVLGSRRWGPVRRLALGSTSERVIRHAACPVLVPPAGADAAARGCSCSAPCGARHERRPAGSRAPPSTSLASSSASTAAQGGRDALALAALLQRVGGGELVAVYVYPFDRTVSLDEAEAVEAVLHEDLLAELEHELRAAGVTARPVVVSDALSGPRPPGDRRARRRGPDRGRRAASRRRRSRAGRRRGRRHPPRGAVRRRGRARRLRRARADAAQRRRRLRRLARVARRPAARRAGGARRRRGAARRLGRVGRDAGARGGRGRRGRYLRGRRPARPPRSSPAAAPTSTCSSWARAPTARCAGCCSAAPRRGSCARHAARCSSSRVRRRRRAAEEVQPSAAAR